MEGYIKLYRKIREWEWYTVPNTKAVFIEIILTANIKDIKYRGQIIPRGHLLTTLDEIASFTGLTKDEVRTAIKNLKTSHTITTQKHLNKLLIKVHNYNDYQELKTVPSHTIPTQPPTQIPHDSHTIPTPNEEEYKEGEEDITLASTPTEDTAIITSSSEQIPTSKFGPDSAEMKLSLLLADRMRKNNPNCKLPNDFQKWCKHIDYMLRLDNRTPKEIQSVIVFSQKDSFWRANILSTRTLREKYDQLYMKMKGGKGSAEPEEGTNNPFLRKLKKEGKL